MRPSLAMKCPRRPPFPLSVPTDRLCCVHPGSLRTSCVVHSRATWHYRISKHQCIQESKSGHSEWTIFRCISLNHTSNSSSGTISKKGSSALSSSCFWHLHTYYLVPRLSETKAQRSCRQAHSPSNWK